MTLDTNILSVICVAKKISGTSRGSLLGVQCRGTCPTEIHAPRTESCDSVQILGISIRFSRTVTVPVSPSRPQSAPVLLFLLASVHHRRPVTI